MAILYKHIYLNLAAKRLDIPKMILFDIINERIKYSALPGDESAFVSRRLITIKMTAAHIVSRPTVAMATHSDVMLKLHNAPFVYS